MTEIQTHLWKAIDIIGNIFFVFKMLCKVKHYSTVVPLSASIFEKITERVLKISKILQKTLIKIHLNMAAQQGTQTQTKT